MEWLHGAGIRIFEITMTIPGAVALIGRLAKDPDLLIGAGTVPDMRRLGHVWTRGRVSSSPHGLIRGCLSRAAKPTPR